MLEKSRQRKHETRKFSNLNKNIAAKIDTRFEFQYIEAVPILYVPHADLIDYKLKCFNFLISINRMFPYPQSHPNCNKRVPNQ